MTTLSTHVLDTAHGRPAAGMRIRLWRDGDTICRGETDADGRCPAIAARDDLGPGSYMLEFDVAEYFAAQGVELPDPPFLGTVSIEFGLADAAGHYHVPLLVSPYGYSTYRGS
ncbi:MAG: hydroxyisourate hydrolase [Sphingomonas sp.]